MSGTTSIISQLRSLSEKFERCRFDLLPFGNGLTAGLPKLTLQGEKSGGDFIELGIFAGIHGDELPAVLGLCDFIEMVFEEPGLIQGYALQFFPICNPLGFDARTRHSPSGKDLNREFWKGSGEPEVIILEREILARPFAGLISLHTDDTSDGVYGYVRGNVLAQALLRPALKAAATHLPINLGDSIDGWPAQSGIISDCFEGILALPPSSRHNPLVDQGPFEVIFETPHQADLDKQRAAVCAALKSILTEYREFISFAANL